MTDDRKKHMARLIRENEMLRDVCAAAMRLRRIGQLADRYQENLEDLYRENPTMPRSATGSIMYAQAYETALKHFDDLAMKAAASGFDWERENIALGPAPAFSNPVTK